MSMLVYMLLDTCRQHALLFAPTSSVSPFDDATRSGSEGKRESRMIRMCAKMKNCILSHQRAKKPLHSREHKKGQEGPSRILLSSTSTPSDTLFDSKLIQKQKETMASPRTSDTTTMRPPAVTPSADDDSLSKRMFVEKGIVDELLLVCGVIGSTDPVSNEFIPVTDCLNWLQDMQRALRRDDDTYRPISLLIGNWKVVEQKLLPLVLTCRYDNPIVLTVVKILVILTKPLSETTKRAGRMVIDTKSRKVPENVIEEQIKLRDNAIQQSEMLMEYKRIFTHHSSHHQDQGLLSIFVSLLAEPLSKTQRSDSDHLTIELVLHLFRNLLSAEPILKSCVETAQKSAQLHHELICLFEKELVLEIILVIAEDMESRENAQYNLLLMELINHLLRNQDPTAVARSTFSKPATQEPGSLTALLQREKQKVRPVITSRHSHFGGTLVINRLDGKRQYISAALVEKGASHPTAQKRKNRKTDPFIGPGRTFAQEGPAATRSQRTLHTFCGRFVKDCYGPLMKSLKNEFRRDSLRLEESDKVVFFRIVWFFCQWWRVSRKNASLEQLIFTMDVFTFNLVLNATDFFQQHKKYIQLAQSVSLYSEMMQLLHVMFQSKDSTEHVMALGLLDRIFYGNDPLDRLPKLLSKWSPGTSTREYVCDLVELTHITLKLLEANDKETPIDKTKNDAISRMKQNAADFDLSSYIVRKIISNQVVFMYSHLLSHYSINAPHVNHHIVAFFLRLSRLHVVMGDDDSRGEMVPQNPLAVKPATLEPMLYNIQLFVVLDRILNDVTIRKEKEYSVLVAFATRLMSRFASHAQTNPMAFVECLFRHPAPHRFCELSTNMYVNEELRMIAERELLLEEQRREDASEGVEFEQEQYRRPPTRNSSRQQSQPAPNGAFADDDEEVEWNDGDKEDSERPASPRPDASHSDDNGDDPKEDEDDERWSDRRAFIPKRKLLSDIDTISSSPPMVAKKQWIQKPVRDERSEGEEEFEFDTSPAGAAAGAGSKRARLIIEDDED